VPLTSEEIREREKAYHARLRTSAQPLPPIDVDYVRRELLTPLAAGGTDRYNDQRVEFHRLLERERVFPANRVLDYGCGTGIMGVYYRLRGARHVVGIDIDEVGPCRGMKRIRVQGLEDSVQLLCGDASDLPLRDASFDLVIGHGVLHHVIKYPRIFDELHRVMAPNSRAYFLENLADNPLFKLWWKMKGEVEEGDVPIFATEVRRLAHRFDTIQVIGFDLVHSLTTFIFKKPMAGWRRTVLRSTKATDDFLFGHLPVLRRWGAGSMIKLEKAPSRRP
jgi:ubiquinone/menaquinone biosynthesis C-methylase UbiE